MTGSDLYARMTIAGESPAAVLALLPPLLLGAVITVLAGFVAMVLAMTRFGRNTAPS